MSCAREKWCARNNFFPPPPPKKKFRILNIYHCTIHYDLMVIIDKHFHRWQRFLNANVNIYQTRSLETGCVSAGDGGCFFHHNTQVINPWRHVIYLFVKESISSWKCLKMHVPKFNEVRGKWKTHTILSPFTKQIKLLSLISFAALLKYIPFSGHFWLTNNSCTVEIKEL